MRRSLTTVPQRPPYLAAPPAVINIDIGRQLFVDDFLDRRVGAAPPVPPGDVPSGQSRARTGSRVGAPRSVRALPRQPRRVPTAMVFSDGVFFDPAEKLFKMWYMAGYQQHTALAVSPDGITWERPALGVVPRHEHRLETAARFEHGVDRSRRAGPARAFQDGGLRPRRQGPAPQRLGRRRAVARGRRVGTMRRSQHVLPQSVPRRLGVQPSRRCR